MKSRSFRRVLLPILAIVLVGSLLLAGIYLLGTSKSHTGTEQALTGKEIDQREESVVYEQAPEDLLQSFAEVLYTYDTRERRFYEGTERFMTSQAYEELKPFSAEEEEEDGENGPVVVSTLQEAKCYYCYFSESEAEVIMESRFTLNSSGNGYILQYIKLTVAKQDDEWKITGIEVLDTLER